MPLWIGAYDNEVKIDFPEGDAGADVTNRPRGIIKRSKIGAQVESVACRVGRVAAVYGGGKDLLGR